MPTYEYRCRECGDDLEVVQSFSDEPLDTCPSCGGRLKKVFGSVGISFKGDGFYKTDSRTKTSASTKADGASTSDGSSGSDGSSESPVTKPDVAAAKSEPPSPATAPAAPEKSQKKQAAPA